MLLVQVRRRCASDLQHVAHRVAHNHVEAEQTVAGIDDIRRLQLHLAQLVDWQIAGQDLRSQSNQFEDFVAQLLEVAVAGQVEMLEQIAPVRQHGGDFLDEIRTSYRVFAVVNIGVDQLHVGFGEDAALRFVPVDQHINVVVALTMCFVVLTCLCSHNTSRRFRAV